jgi:hypothetical protein
MYRLLTAIAMTTATLMLLQVAVRWIGTLSSPPIALAMLDTGPCAQPCWQGIQPGKTTLDKVAELLREQSASTKHSIQSLYSNELCWDTPSVPSWRGCVRRQWEVNPGTPIKSIELEPPPDTLRLGDAINVLGEPVASRLCQVSRGRLPAVPGDGIIAHVYFRGNVFVTAYSPGQPNEARLTPDMLVRWLFYYAAAEPLYDDGVPRWRGFNAPLDARFCGL